MKPSPWWHTHFRGTRFFYDAQSETAQFKITLISLNWALGVLLCCVFFWQLQFLTASWGPKLIYWLNYELCFSRAQVGRSEAATLKIKIDHFVLKQKCWLASSSQASAQLTQLWTMLALCILTRNSFEPYFLITYHPQFTFPNKTA